MITKPAPNPEPLTPDTLLVFLDETGDEQYSDPKHPVFGIGGCAIRSEEYVHRIRMPWVLLKRDVLGLINQPFHAVDFERSRPAIEKILAINTFLKRGFHRIAVTTDRNTARPNGYDGHETVSTVLFEYIRRLIGSYSSRRCMIFFEHSEKAAELLGRNFPVRGMDARNLFFEKVAVDGFTMPKTSAEAGLELADLIIHTAGKQQRRHGKGYVDGIREFTLDFQAVFMRFTRRGTSISRLYQ